MKENKKLNEEILILKSNDGFSLVEVALSLLLVGGLAMAMGHGLAVQKKQDVFMSNKLGLTSLLENVAHRLNSTDYATKNLKEFREHIVHHRPADVAVFDSCVQNIAAVNCQMFQTDTLNFPPIVVSESTLINQGTNLKVDWTSSIQCTANSCSSFNTNAVATLVAAPAIQATDDYKLLQTQLGKMLTSSQRNFPVLNLFDKIEKSYACANDGSGAAVVGLNPGNVEAKCAPLSGHKSCSSDQRPMMAFGGDPNVRPEESCEPLVNTPVCGEGLGTGGLFAGDCKAPTTGGIQSYVQTDGNGNAISVTVCGPGTSTCVVVALSARSPASDVVAELRNSPQYNQIMTTWQNEGTLTPLTALPIEDINGFDAINGEQLEGARGITITTTSGPPTGVASSNGAAGVSGARNVDPNIFPE